MNPKFILGAYDNWVECEIKILPCSPFRRVDILVMLSRCYLPVGKDGKNLTSWIKNFLARWEPVEVATLRLILRSFFSVSKKKKKKGPGRDKKRKREERIERRRKEEERNGSGALGR